MSYLLPAGVLVGAIAVLVFIDNPYIQSLINYSLINVILALSLQLIVGFAGQLSLGHAAFFGVGAYTSAILTTRLGLPFSLGLVAAAVVSGLAGLVMSPVVRTRGVYFSLATLAFGIIVQLVFVNWVSLTRGTMGIPGIPSRLFGNHEIQGPQGFFILLFLVTWAQYYAFSALIASRFGRALKAIRENEIAAQAVGINVVLYKIKAIVIGSAFAGVAGSAMAHFNGFVSPEPFTWWKSIVLVIMIVVGGLGSFPGAVIGAFALTFLSEYFRSYAEYSMLIYGLLIVIFMIFLPGGVVGVRKSRFSYKPALPKAKG